MNIKTQIIDTSKRCKDKFNNMIENTLYKYDCYLEYNKLHNFYKGQYELTRQIKAKVSLATAWFNNKYSNVDLSKAAMGHSDCIIHNSEAQDELRRKELNSKK